MRIAYIYFILAKTLVGVEKKIKEQAKCSPENFDFFILNRFSTYKYERVNFVKMYQGRGYHDYLFRKFYLIENSIDLAKYDYIILRYPFADKTCHDFLKKHKVISEHHSDEISELKANLTNRSPNYRKLASLVRLLLEYKYGKDYRIQCKGIVTVTNELRFIQMARIKTNIPSITISNGIHVEAITKTGFKRLNTKTLHLIFVASKLAPWQGLERIIKSLNQYKGRYDITLHIVGDINAYEMKTRISKNIIYYGVRTGNELDQIFYKANLAVSTMGLYLKKMKEAAPLKTREYTARGIPFVLAYDDIDLGDVDDDKKFYVEVPNNGEDIQFEKIIEFIEEINKKYEKTSELSRYMRDYAFAKMDWRQKMKRYMEFCWRIECGEREDSHLS